MPCWRIPVELAQVSHLSLSTPPSSCRGPKLSPAGWETRPTRRGRSRSRRRTAAQQLLQVDAPFFGRLLSDSLFPSPAVLRSSEFTVRCVEAVLGHPLNVVAWLASELPRHGRHLGRGDRVTTGTAATVYFAYPGDHVIADFGPFGRSGTRLEHVTP